MLCKDVELPKFILEVLERESGGGDLVAYLVELLGRELDPEDRTAFYVESSDWFWEEGVRLLEKGDYRQAGEKMWNSVVQAVRAVAERGVASRCSQTYLGGPEAYCPRGGRRYVHKAVRRG